jgi:cytoskeletal protein CcmA (bactofilin family)
MMRRTAKDADMPVPSKLTRKRTAVPSVLLILVLLLLPLSTRSSVFRSGDDLHISKLHTIEDDFYAFGKQLRVDGMIDGDLSAFAYKTILKGSTIRGSANIFSFDLDCTGHITGSLRAFAQTATIAAHIDRSVLAMGSNIRLRPGCVVERDATLFGENISIDGVVTGNVVAAAQSIYITGTINGDAKLEGDNIIISPPAVIAGNLTYTSKKELDFSQETGITIGGDITWKPPEEAEKHGTGLLASVSFRISSLLAAFLFGIIVVRLFRPYAEESFVQLRERPSVAISAGFLGVLIIGACVLVLIITLVTAIAGWILIQSNFVVPGSLLLIASTLLLPITSFASVTGGIILYSGRIITAFVLGYLMIKMTNREKERRLTAWSLLLGLILLTAVFAIPYLGVVLFILVTLTGSGAIYLGIRHCRKDPRSGFQQNKPPSSSLPPPQPPNVEPGS